MKPSEAVLVGDDAREGFGAAFDAVVELIVESYDLDLTTIIAMKVIGDGLVKFATLYAKSERDELKKQMEMYTLTGQPKH